MKENDYISKLLTGREIEAPERSKKKGKRLRREAEFGPGYIKY